MFRLLLSAAAAITAVAAAPAVAPARRQTVTCASSGQITTNEACCVFFDVREELFNNILLNACFDNLHGDVRLAFHDAVGFSQALAAAGEFPGGGADGSIAIFEQELLYIAPDGASPNAGLFANVQFAQDLAAHHGISLGDAIQFSAAAGLTLCPGGPVVPFFAGRANATQPSPQDLVPTPDLSVTAILARMADMGNFTPDEVVALLGAHTTGDQSFVDTVNQNQPFDSTPFIFDSQFFLETLIASDPGFGGTPGGQLQATGVFRLSSDALFARDSRTACAWQDAIDHDSFLTSFQNAMLKMSLVGFNQDDLIDCSDTIPSQAATLTTPAAFFPPGFTLDDIEVSCFESDFPTLPSAAGPQVSVQPIQDQDTPDP